MTRPTKKKNIYLIGPLLLESKLVNQHLKDEPADYIVYIDAGLQFKEEIKTEANSYSLGDGDGPTDLRFPRHYADQLDKRFPPSKDQSDLELALKHLEQTLNFGLELNYEIKCFGLWGGRLDHQLANLGVCYHWLKSFPQTVHFSHYNHEKIYALICHGYFEMQYSGLFSLFNLDHDNSIDLSGDVKYKITQSRPYPLSSLGLSNEASGLIKINGASPYIFIFPEE
jgi:thiamine pyrophosphokinase